MWSEDAESQHYRKLYQKTITTFLFHLNAHIILNTYIYHQLLPICFDVCYTNFRETIVLFAQELLIILNNVTSCL